jgi:GntR family transcriptional regulator/MocR family aminotransferase
MTAAGLLREALDLRRVAVPRVSYPALAGALRRPGPPTTWLDVDQHGAVFDQLPRSRGCGALVQPAHHYPLGVIMPEERAEALVTWARGRGGLVLENDANAELFFDGPGPRALQAAAPDCTVLMGSVSRTLAPGLRMGWLVAPPELARRLGRHRAHTDPGPPVIDQMAFARFLADGALDAHVRRLRGTCRARSRVLAAALRRELPRCAVSAPPSGLHVTVALEPGTDEARVTEAAAASEVLLFGLAGHVLHGEPLPPGLVIGFGALPEPSAGAAARAVRRALAVRASN